MADHVLTDILFESFQLHPLVQQGLVECGYTHCTPIQALTLPEALAGHDVAGQAQTGTGKTCAFLVALMQHLLTQPAPATRNSSDPRALIIAPTRELAIQIDKDARAIGVHTGLETVLIYGGVDYDKQRQSLKAGCDIIIATPGRLLDYYKQHVFRLDSIEVMVVDEADRMFDLGFIKDVRYIFRRLPPRDERQVLLYSATLSYRVLELAYEHMHEAKKLVADADHVTADKVRQSVYFPAREEKLPLLLNLIKKEQPERVLVFVNTRTQTERVRDNLRRHGYRVGALSGDVPQEKRQRVLKRFTAGELDMLVCTDVAARGLHIPHVTHVFNYDLPQDAEDYVHRIGRTARLGEEGDAISFACDRYAMSLPDIEAFIGQKVPVRSIDPELLVTPQPVAPARVAATEADAAESSAPQHKPRRRSKRGSHAKGSEPQGADTSHDGVLSRSAQVTRNERAEPAVTPESGKSAAAATTDNDTGATGTSGNRRRRNRRRTRSGHGSDGGQGVAQGTTSVRSAQPEGHHAARRVHPADGGAQCERADTTSAAASAASRAGRQARQARGPSDAPAPQPTVSGAHRSANGQSTEIHAKPASEPARRGFFTRLLKGVLKVHKETTG